MQESVREEVDQYSIAIPFREDTMLPNKKAMAERRLAYLARKP